MIELVEGLPDGAFGVEAKGKLSPDDYKQVMIPAIQAEFAKHDKLSLLIVIDDDFKGLEAGALWDDAKLGLSHLFAWSKIAIVTNHEWYTHIAGVSGFLTHAEVKIFKVADRDAATAWVSEGL
jgi:hypothetical protein